MKRPILVQYRDEVDKYLPGDRHLRRFVRYWRDGEPSHLSGVRRVVRNFLTGMDRLGIRYSYNPVRSFRRRDEPIISFGLGQLGLVGVSERAPLIAAIGFPYPVDFPDLCERYNVRYVLQHSKWVCDLVRSAKIYDPAVFNLWPAGVDTEEWKPVNEDRSIDVLLYIKIHWDREGWNTKLVQPILEQLKAQGLSVEQVSYGQYTPDQYRRYLANSKAMVFLSPHETQGFAYLEALASGLPVYAWDPGVWMDPERFRYGLDKVHATSVPFFDERCGATFVDSGEFATGFDEFWERVNGDRFKPRDYVLDNVTIERSTEKMLSYYENL